MCLGETEGESSRGIDAAMLATCLMLATSWTRCHILFAGAVDAVLLVASARSLSGIAGSLLTTKPELLVYITTC